MSRTVLAAALAGALLVTAPTLAADPPPEKTPEELVAEGMNTLMQAMQLFLKSIPQFGEPYVNDNGDIVIPRIHPEESPEKGDKPEIHRKQI